MSNDQHESFLRMIDESLAGPLSVKRERSLREHLDSCTPCRKYLAISNRVIKGLAEFSFAVDPGLNARVIVHLNQPAQQIEGAKPSHWQWWLVSVAALILTLGGSFFDLQFASLLAYIFDLKRLHLRQELLAYWIVPSLGTFLLFPLLPILSRAGTGREKGTL